MPHPLSFPYRANCSVGFSTANDGASIAIQNLNTSSMSSMEQFVTGVQIMKAKTEESSTPGFRPPDSEDEEGNFGGDAVGPTIDELDPYFPRIPVMGVPTVPPPPGSNWPITDDGTKFMEENDYRIVWHDGVQPSGLAGGGNDTNVWNASGDFNLRKHEDAIPGSRSGIEVVKPNNALRGPLIISGWGYGMDDFPVPTNVDAEFPYNLQFDENMPGNRSLWKTGPVHLMWDDERQIWQGGYHIVCGVVEGGITAPLNVCEPTTFKVNLFRNTQHIEDPEDSSKKLRLSDAITPKEQICVQNRDPSLEQSPIANAIFCIAIKLNYEWLPIWVGCPEAPACPGPPCIINDACVEETSSSV